MSKDYNTDLMKEEEKKESTTLNVDDKDVEPSSKPIHKSMIIAEIVDSHPDVIPLLMESGMHCIGCGASMFETLEEGFIGHGMDDAEIDRIITDINKYIKEMSETSSNKNTQD